MNASQALGRGPLIALRRRGAIALVLAAIAPVLLAPAAGAEGGAEDTDVTRALPGDSPIPFWPHETGVSMGTSETYVDVHGDGSYYDPSVGWRVAG